jgi:hypothetical protein
VGLLYLPRGRRNPTSGSISFSFFLMVFLFFVWVFF